MVKTALELALEKVAKMPKLGSEELEGQKKEQLLSAGSTLANRLLSGKLHQKDLALELTKYPEESQATVRNAILDTLHGMVVLNDPAANDRIISLASKVNEKLEAEALRSAIDDVIAAYQQQRRAKQVEMIEMKQEEYAELGISGTGFVPNVCKGEQWEGIIAELEQRFLEKLPGFNP